MNDSRRDEAKNRINEEETKNCSQKAVSEDDSEREIVMRCHSRLRLGKNDIEALKNHLMEKDDFVTADVMTPRFQKGTRK